MRLLDLVVRLGILSLLGFSDEQVEAGSGAQRIEALDCFRDEVATAFR